MKPYYQDNHIKIYNKDCRDMSELADGSIQCVVTSPPYWGLRKYSGEQELIWGDKDCEHKWHCESVERQPIIASDKSGLVGGLNPRTTVNGKYKGEGKNIIRTGFCSLCGAWKGAYGLEPTPEMYIEHTIEILREIRRVLRKDGVVWWNIGDSYAGSGKGQDADGSPSSKTGKLQKSNKGTQVGGLPVSRFDKWNSDTPGSIQVSHDTPKANYLGLKPKDLCLIPFRVAIACQEDGWWVRSVIIWSKPNPMPESVTDRPTESHEYILMLTKSKSYYWDADAVREKQLQQSIDRMTRNHLTDYDPNYPTQGPQNLHFGEKLSKAEAEAMSGRNIRSVWEFPTQPYPEAHFAVFPEKLPEICIKAASKPDDLILDPFMGAGTTLWVAKKLNRRAIGYEISEEYCQLALERNRQQAMM